MDTNPSFRGSKTLPTTAARQAAVLFAASGLLALAALATQPEAGFPLVWVAAADFVVAVLAWALPWDRWPHRATALLTLPALAIIGFTDRYGGASPYTYVLFFVILFAWIGVSQPPATPFLAAPFATLAYVIPLTTSAHDPVAVQSTMVAIPICVMIAELLSRAMVRLREAERRSQRRASLLAMLARANDDIASLDPDEVLDRVVLAVLELGYEGGAVDLLDEEEKTFSVLHGRGLPEEYTAAVHPLKVGELQALVRRAGRSVTLFEHSLLQGSVPALRAAGFRVVVGAPIRQDGRVAAVLMGARRSPAPPAQEELEAFELLAAQSGRALENARRFEAQASAAAEHAQASLTDALTGIGSRRMANHLLDSLRPGDAVILVDLDHFKVVNDTLGHAGGDRVLVEVGEYLRRDLREDDAVARFGGEEFVVVLRRPKQVAEIAGRLVRGWSELEPVTTFSAGAAVHVQGSSPALTLAAADRALYAAKHGGRARAEICREVAQAYEPKASGEAFAS